MVMRRSKLVAFSLLAFSFAQARADAQDLDLKEGFPELKSSTLQISFAVRILGPDETAVWNVESTRLTIPGRSVRVRLDGDNVVIYLICTPYVQPDGGILLVAQGQIWLSEPTAEDVKYYSPFYNIPVSLGEKILFFPLGLPEDAGDKGFYNIEMQIKIDPYQKEETKPAAPEEAAPKGTAPADKVPADKSPSSKVPADKVPSGKISSDRVPAVKG